MRVLMFGWEFPPHISGGLGTACFGLTKGMAKLNEVEVVFVVPKAFGDEEPTDIQLIGANEVPVAQKEIQFEDVQQKIDYYEVESQLVPYVGEEEFWNLKSKVYSKKTRFIQTDDGLRVDFTGKYDAGLLNEIRNYAWVAEIIARNNNFDIIHAHDWLAYPAGIAAKKISGKPLSKKIEFIQGDSEALPFDDNYFDAITVSFGIRNFENLEKGLSEILRVLRKDGIFVILETSVPTKFPFKQGYHFYAKNVLPLLGRLFSKDKVAYQYLSESASVFPFGEELNNILRKIGFKDVDNKPQTFGVATIYTATK